MSTGTATRERPIPFGAPMVRAILAGRKTVTRRVVKGPLDFIGPGGKSGPNWDDPSCWGWADEYGDYHTLAPDGESSCDKSCCIPCPYGRPGDVLWVKEAAYIAPPGFGDPIDSTHRDYEGRSRVVAYAASMNGAAVLCAEDYGVRKRPSIHMPRWASRITLEITGVRVERVQAISEQDAIAEGIQRWTKDGRLWKFGHIEPGEPGATPWSEMERTARDGFARLWDAINGKRPGCSWEANPFVWAISFRRLTP